MKVNVLLVSMFSLFLNIRLYSKVVQMKYLNVAEKNDAAKTISGLLSKGASRRREGLSPYNKIYEFDYNVRGQNAQMLMTSVSGHLLNFAFVASFKSWQSCNPEQLFEAPVVKTCSDDYIKIRKTLEREVRSCNGLIIWTDCDREGENIGFEIIEVCRAIKPNIPIYRAKFSEITAASVKRAITNLIEPDQKQSQAVDVRMELDLRIGAAFTRFQTLRLQNVFPTQISNNLVSYGSCQIPTLGFVAQRYKEIEDFISQPFWKLRLIHIQNDLSVEFNWSRNRLFNKQSCESFLMLCQANPTAKVINVVQKPKSKWRPLPLDTVELEKLGSRKLKINAKQTMTIAEKLYTQGIISYPRTETNVFSKDIQLAPLVELHAPHPDWGGFASKVLEWGVNPRNGTKSDQAHPPIHPIKLSTTLSGDEKKIYELIVRHFLACVSRDAVGSETIVTIDVANEEFTANGLCIHERNYLEVYHYDRWNAKEIHTYIMGNTFEPTELSLHEGSTSAPSILTEADLIALMEKHGIGTDATHAEHINTIKERGYIGVSDRGGLVPGTLGMGLVEGYDAMELPLARPKLRSDLEKDLKLICNGRRDPKEVLAEQIVKYKDAYKVITEKALLLDQSLASRFNEQPRVAPEITASTQIDDIMKCPKCNYKFSMALKPKKDNNGWYIGCMGFPECKNVVWLNDMIKDIKATSTVCTKCGPGFKKVEIKFKQSNILGLLNASSNVYTTCIVCDAKLRDILNINEENVKKITQNTNAVNGRTNMNTNPRSNSTASTAPSSNSRPNSSVGWGSGSNNSQRNNSRNTNAGWGSSSNDSQRNNSENTNVGWGSGSITTERNNPTNTNVGWGSGSNNTDRNNSANTSRGWGNGSNTSEINIPTNANRGWGSQERGRTNTANRGWGSVSDENGNNTHNRSPGGWGSSNAATNTRGFSGASTAPANSNTTTWGSQNGNAGHSSDSSRITNPNTSNNRNNKRNKSDETIVKCTTCKTVLKKLTVRKEGPNTGRQFYSCSTPPCNFFKWADDVVPVQSSTNNDDNDNDQPGPSRAKRKCGICRQEGHTKLKCPQGGSAI